MEVFRRKSWVGGRRAGGLALPYYLKRAYAGAR